MRCHAWKNVPIRAFHSGAWSKRGQPQNKSFSEKKEKREVVPEIEIVTDFL